MKFKKAATASLALIMAASLSAGLTSCKESSKAAETIKIGLLLSSSGSTAVLEKSMINAAVLAFDEINEAGGINGKKIEYIHEDYASDPAKATEKIKKLIEQDEVVATVGCLTSASRQATLPTLKDDNSLLVYPVYTEGEEIHPNVIYVGAMPNQQATDYVPWLIEHEGKKVFFVGSDYVYPKTCNKQAKALVEMNGGEIVGEEYAPLGQTDFATIVQKIKQANPDFIYCDLVGDSAISFYKTYKQYGLDPNTCPIAAITVDEMSVQGMGAEYAAGHYTSMNYFSTLATEKSQEFAKKYNEKFTDGSTLTCLAEATYDSVYLLSEALQKVSDPKDTTALINAFSGLEFDAPQGKIKVDDSNHCTWMYSRFGKCNDKGEFEIVYESSGTIKPEPWPSILYPDGAPEKTY